MGFPSNPLIPLPFVINLSLMVVIFSSFTMVLEVIIAIVMIQELVFLPRTHHHFHQSRRGCRCTRISSVFQ